MNQPLWSPRPEHAQTTHLARFIQWVGAEVAPDVSDYPSLYRFSIDRPEAFWSAVWEFGEVRAARRGDPP